MKKCLRGVAGSSSELKALRAGTSSEVAGKDNKDGVKDIIGAEGALGGQGFLRVAASYDKDGATENAS